MLRLIVCFIYIAGYLIYSIPNLKRMQSLPEMTASKKDRIIHAVPYRWSRNIMKLTGAKVNVRGSEFLIDGPVLFVSNHEGDFDVPVLLGFIEKPFGFISKIEVKKVPILSSWMEIMNCVFLDRKDRRQAIKSIREGSEFLKNGHSLVIFPEGTRSKGGALGEFKSGSLRLAKDAGVPIIPISIEGTSDLFEKNGRLIKPANISLTICEPILFDNYKNQDLKELAAEIKETIIKSRNEQAAAS
ncbi:lysophospholipid acyltransferase family protein [Mesobacillus zeae]|uniref:1-acyl-sn-glycerol-3-phosphate acyltransferase n=1 Tax=Mesobacillus zeae TaxID=1917180 RepID=A0A398B2R3_9BACI|nr:lysophospholipid acyltransferase family protein [Mesobacillus zeae]RID84145.1 1-acyl-sn-glycerol-3-phosphate acyltransferase [Mesobacillus zeae]